MDSYYAIIPRDAEKDGSVIYFNDDTLIGLRRIDENGNIVNEKMIDIKDILQNSSLSSGVKSSVQNYKAGQVYKDNKGGTLTIDYVGPRAINYHFDGENKGANQATFTQFEAVLDANGFTAIKSAFPGENPRDEYLKMMGRNMRENQATLTQDEFDDAMDNNGNFIRGFYKWDSDSHNWGCEVDVNLYLVVSYHTDGGGVFICLIDTSSGKREVVTTRHIHFLDYNDVVKECIDIGEKMNEDFTEFFE